MSASEVEDDDLSPVEDDLEMVQETDNAQVADPNEAEEANQEQGGEADTENKKEVKVKRVRNPQPKLNVDRLKGPRGLQVLESVFKDVKFKGRGHEEDDLGVLMKKYEYWCHRLFPKFPFDDSLERMEKLGVKKPLQNYIKRIRMDLVLDDEVIEPQEDNDAVDENIVESQDTQRSSFDDLLPPQQATDLGPTGLTEEQLELIRINRERAQRLRHQLLSRSKARSDSILNTQTQNQENQTSIEDVTLEVSQNSSIGETLKEVDFATEFAESTPAAIVESSHFTSDGFETNSSQVSTAPSQASCENMSTLSVGTPSNVVSDDEGTNQSINGGKSSNSDTDLSQELSRDTRVASEITNSESSLEGTIEMDSNRPSSLECMSIDSVEEMIHTGFSQKLSFVSIGSQMSVDCKSTSSTNENDSAMEVDSQN